MATYSGTQKGTKQDVLLDSMGHLPKLGGVDVEYDVDLYLRAVKKAAGDTGNNVQAEATFSLSVGGNEIASSSAVPAGGTMAVADTSGQAANMAMFPNAMVDVPINFEGMSGDKIKLDVVCDSTTTIYYRIDAEPA